MTSDEYARAARTFNEGLRHGKREQLRSVLTRLRNPDEEMVEAVAKGMWTGIGEASPFSRLTMLGQARDAIRALADVLAATPPATEE